MKKLDPLELEYKKMWNEYLRITLKFLEYEHEEMQESILAMEEKIEEIKWLLETCPS